MIDKSAKILVATIVGLAMLPTISFAQFNLASQVNPLYALSDELEVEIIPTYPRPNEMVFINLSLYTDDLDSATITWYKDGKNVLSGKGETSYSFKTGPIGQSTSIEIVVRLLGGSSFSKTVYLRPAGVDLIWEANSYVPPFYGGKALHPKQGSLKVVAMPEFVRAGQRVSPQNLIYKWSNGINTYKNQSGYGRNTLVLDGSLLGRGEKIGVLVTDPASGLVAQSFVSISPVDPEVIFYENSPYYGHIFDLAINNNFSLKSDEIQLLAAPYYFTREEEGVLQSEWRLNNQAASSLDGSRTAIFRKPEEKAGRSAISLRITNPLKILQQANIGLIVNFEK